MDGRMKQVGKPDPVQHLVAHAIDDAKGDFRAILRGIDMNAERTLAERRIDDPDDRIGHRGRISFRRHDRRERFLDLLAKPGIGTRFIFRDARQIGRRTRMREMIGAPVKAPGTMIEVSMPQRTSSRVYTTAIASMPAFAAKYGDRYGGVPPATLLEDTQTNSPRRCWRSCGKAARLTRWVESTLTS
jgi:hypothetical protein